MSCDRMYHACHVTECVIDFFLLLGYVCRYYGMLMFFDEVLGSLKVTLVSVTPASSVHFRYRQATEMYVHLYFVFYTVHTVYACMYTI